MKRRNTTSGFTLLEMTVSIGLFAVVVLISLSSLISLSQEAKKAQATRTVVGNLGATIESMTRSIRMAKDFQCEPTIPATGITATTPTDCKMGSNGNNGRQSIAFMPITGVVNPLPIVYKLESGRIMRSLEGGKTTPNTYLPFTAEGVTITSLQFFVAGSSPGKQPMITISLEGYTDTNRISESTFNVQTTVVARTPNL
jgi:prepilin-type N-terminal cleavage/methylation domain-containing protein